MHELKHEHEQSTTTCLRKKQAFARKTAGTIPRVYDVVSVAAVK